MRWTSVVTFLVCVLAAGAHCKTTTTGPGYSGTDCPAFNVTTSACATCLETDCAAEVTNLNNDCTVAEFSCACPANASVSNCTLSTTCSNAASAWTSCVEGNCAGTCTGSSTGNCGQPAGGCVSPDVAATKRAGCCTVAACASGIGAINTCSDSCGNVWFETNNTLYGPCAAGDYSCDQSTAQTALNNCN